MRANNTMVIPPLFLLAKISISLLLRDAFKVIEAPSLNQAPASVSPENTFDSDSWEPADNDKGIVARAVLYMAVRYEADASAASDLELSVSPNSTTQLIGKLTTMLDDFCSII